MTGSLTPAGADTYSSAIVEARNYSKWVIDAFDGFFGRHILEVGIGHGTSIEHLSSVEDYTGVDIDPGSVATARTRHPERSYICEDIASTTFVQAAGAGRYDTVICLNTLEHVERDREAIGNLLAVLSPGGHLLIFVPAFQTLFSSLDRLAGHVRRYTRDQLAMLVDGREGVVVKNAYFNPIGGAVWWLNKFIGHRSLNDQSVNTQIRVFDRYVLPISRAINPVTQKIFGQSVVFVVRKL